MSTINAILMQPGNNPTICKLSNNVQKQMEEIAAFLSGNFASSRLFHVGSGISLHIFVNDLAVPLGLPANRYFPAPDDHEIVFGNALFLAVADNDDDDIQGVLDIPEDICELFIEKLAAKMPQCNGSERPSPESELYTENAGTEEERTFLWQEIEKPADCKLIGKGWVKLVDDGCCNIIETHGRYFKQVEVLSKDNPLQ